MLLEASIDLKLGTGEPLPGGRNPRVRINAFDQARRIIATCWLLLLHGQGRLWHVGDTHRGQRSSIMPEKGVPRTSQVDFFFVSHNISV